MKFKYCTVSTIELRFTITERNNEVHSSLCSPGKFGSHLGQYGFLIHIRMVNSSASCNLGRRHFSAPLDRPSGEGSHYRQKLYSIQGPPY